MVLIALARTVLQKVVLIALARTVLQKVALIALVCVAVYLTLDWLLDKDVAALSEQIRQLFSA